MLASGAVRLAAAMRDRFQQASNNAPGRRTDVGQSGDGRVAFDDLDRGPPGRRAVSRRAWSRRGYPWGSPGQVRKRCRRETSCRTAMAARGSCCVTPEGREVEYIYIGALEELRSLPRLSTVAHGRATDGRGSGENI